jgi:Ca2+-binding RTX toxin-like protein
MVTLVRHDLQFILDQIKIAEAHAAGTPLTTLVDSPLLPWGLRTVDGSYNNIVPGRETWGASGEPFARLTTPVWRNENDDTMPPGYVPGNNNDYGVPGSVADADPRTISNLIVDQTLDNPAAIAAALRYAGVEASQFLGIIEQIQTAHVAFQAVATLPEDNPAYIALKGQLDALLDQHSIEMSGPSIVLPNEAPDEGLSASYNSWFTLFGQFFDHGLDLVAKGGNGTIYIPLQLDDPLYDHTPGALTNFMAVTRATVGDNAANVTTPWVDQNQTYTSHPSHQVFLREYHLVDGRPVATGKLLDGERGLATWGDVKAQALMLGIELTDIDVFAVPLIRTDAYGKFIPDANGYAQVITGLGPDGIPNTADDIVVSGTPTNPVNPTEVEAIRTANAFLDDIAHTAVPVQSLVPVTGSDGEPDFDEETGEQLMQLILQPDPDNVAGNPVPVNNRGQNTQYDDELLDAHYITGDGRGNENIGLSAVHHIFHAEHNRQADHVKDVVLEAGDLAFLNEWLLQPVTAWPATEAAIEALVWDGERVFQAARFTTEMQYQHLVFEEFARKVQPDVDIFMVQPDVNIDPAIFAEFAHVVYRFGHSMLNETVDRIEADGTVDNMTLFDAFLNPLAFGSDTMDHHAAAGAIIRGMTAQVGNEIDEFTTNVLRNQLVGIPLDLAAINIARGRDTGMPSLNEARAQFQALANGDSQLKPYDSWIDFALNMKNPESIVNFIAAYGTHGTITAATTIEDKRDAAMALVFGGTGAPADRMAFLNATGQYANRKGGLDDVDLWIGGLAEKKMPFGGMLGSTFAFVFELQMENLQHADRFYYLSRVQGLNLLTELENNSLAKMVMRNTDLGEAGFALPGDIFSVPDHVLYVELAKQLQMTRLNDPEHDNPWLEAISSLVERGAVPGSNGGYLRYNGSDHVVIAGTDAADIIISGGGDDTIWGFGGDDYIEAGYGVDKVMGGDGDDIIVNAGTDIGETDMLHGDAGNDVIHGGSGMALIFGGSGQDFLMTGPDGSEIRGGTDNDFIMGGNGPDMLFGNEGDDWIEGAGGFEYIAGDNGELFFNSTIIGHDVLNGGSGDTDYDADSGDDIMVAGEGIQKFIGMWGHDWVIHKGQEVGADADMNFPVFDSLPLEVLRDRYSQVEALSGWRYDDILRGDDRTTEEDDEGLTPDPTPEGNFMHNELDEAGIARIAGLDQIIKPHMLQQGSYWADGSGEEKLIFTGGNILLGGGGSDFFEGRGGDDVIDGDAWLNVRISIRDGNGEEIGTAEGMSTVVTDGNGNILHGGRTLDLLMLDRTYNPGQLHIVREILWDDSGIDTAFYWDVFENYEVTRNQDGSIRVAHITQTEGAIDPITNQNRTSDGIDTLYNIERLQFGEQIIDVGLLFNSPPTGLPVISDMTPTQNQPLDVDLSAISDPDGIASELSVQWQHLVGGEWVDIGGATGTTFTPGVAHINTLLRVVVSFQDGSGNTEQVVSAVTSTVGAHIIGTNAANELVGTAGADLIEGLGGADLIYGGAGNDTIHGGAGADVIHGDDGDDIIHGDAGADVIDGGAGNDTIYGGAGADTIHGGDGDDIIHGDAGADVIDGGAGNDTIYGGAGADTIHGGAGDDTIIWNAGDGRDLVDGGSGDETVGDTFVVNGDDTSEEFRVWTREAWIDQAPLAQRGNLDDTTEIVITRNGSNWGQVIAQLSNIEEIVLNGGPVSGETGTQGGDTFYLHGDFSETSLNQNTITITGGSSDDTVNLSGLLSSHRVVFKSNGGNDTIIGMLRPQDVVELAEGKTIDDYDSVTNADGSTTMSTEGHSVTFFGSAKFKDDDHHDHDDEDDDDSDDHDDDDDNDDTCGDDDGPSAPPPAGSGSLHQIGTAAADVLIGTSGNDTLIGLGGNDTILGGSGDDVILGGDGDDYLFGEDGNDTIHGGAGNDDIFGGAGKDVIFGDAGNDRIYGGAGNDYINAGAGNDTVFAGAGDDIVVAQIGDGDDVYYGGDADGDSGNDTLDMSTITADIIADLGTGFMGRGSVQSVQTGNDTIWGFENIITGSGNDVITASRAVNVMDGGAGQDTFRFLSAADADGDLILGFEPGDRIDLSMADANACLAGRQSFELVTEEAFTGRGQLMVSHENREDGDYTIVHLNTTGGAQADYKFAIKGTHNLSESDFHL